MGDSEARVARRRNGRLVACNPCRMRKVACDHLRPICTRCLRRKRGRGCVYPDSESSPVPVQPDSASLPIASGSETLESPVDGEGHPHQLLQSPHRLNTGFMAFASQSTVLEETRNGLDRLGISVAANASEVDLASKSRLQHISFKDLPKPLQESCLFILRCLPGQCNEQIKFTRGKSQGGGWGHVAVDLIIQSLQQTFDTYLNSGDAGLEAMAAVLCNNTAQPFRDIHNSPHEWLSQFCGANLRWESLGLLWAELEHISDVVDALNNRSIEWINDNSPMHIAQTCLGYCIDICRHFTGGNDLFLDICCRMSILDSLVDGEITLPSFRSHSIAVAMLTFLGLHVLDDNPDYLPTFCSENKRRLFCRVFTIDKMGMVISGRPPCIGARYCSTPLPLDLQDEDLVSDSATLTKAVKSLDSKGWNTDGGIYPATVLRARHMIAHIRDQIFEIALGRNVTVRLEELLTLKEKQLSLMSEFPQGLIYLPNDAASPHLSTRTLWMRMLIKLEHLQNLFFVDKLLIRHGHVDDGDLLIRSYELVALALKLWTNKDRFDSIYIRRSFEFVALTYGAPGGGILCQELLQPTFNGVHHKNPQLSRSNIVQQLSLLAGFLEWVPKKSPNWRLCIACKGVIQQVLDHHLNATIEDSHTATIDPMHWEFLDQPRFTFDLLNTFGWMGPESQ